MEAGKTIYSFSQLNSIQYMLNANWEKDIEDMEDLDSPQSILELVSIEKLANTDTRNLRESMECAKFDERCISEIQNFKTSLSNNRARLRYRESVRKLKQEKNELKFEKQELEKEIAFYTSIESALFSPV